LILMSTFSSLPDALIYRNNKMNEGVNRLVSSSESSIDDRNKEKFDDSIGGISYYLMTGLSKLIALFFHEMPSKKLIQNVKAPIIIFHSESDSLIPFRCAEILQSSNPRCKLVTIEGDHPSPDIKPEQVCQLFEMSQVSVTYDLNHLEQILDLMRRFFTELKNKNYIA